MKVGRGGEQRECGYMKRLRERRRAEGVWLHEGRERRRAEGVWLHEEA